jgi:hypothetical protein
MDSKLILGAITTVLLQTGAAIWFISDLNRQVVTLNSTMEDVKNSLKNSYSRTEYDRENGYVHRQIESMDTRLRRLENAPR